MTPSNRIESLIIFGFDAKICDNGSVLRERTCCCDNDGMIIIFVTLFVGDNGGMAY